MATVTKDFRVKNGLVVEGANGTINSSDIITAASLTGGTQTNIAVTYNPTTKQVSLVAENGVADSTTTDLQEGTNLYFTDERAQDAFAAAINAGTHQNIAITYDDASGAISFVAENGVADSTTDDLAEGSNNLYFTDARARDAISAGSGIAYDSATGVVSASLGNGLTLSGSDIVIDDSVVATDSDVSTAVGDHSDLTTGVHGVTGNVVGTTDTQTVSNKTLGSDLNADSNQITNLATPTLTHHAATKGYVDTAVSGLTWKDSVNLLADSNVDISGDLVGTVIDGHGALEITDTDYRILLINQNTDSENGIYELSDVAGELIASRPADSDTFEELADAAVLVKEGTTYGTSTWVQSNHYLTDFTGQSWVQFGGNDFYVSGNGLQTVGNEFSIDTGVTVDVATAQTLSNKTIGTDLDADGNQVVNLGTPSNANDAATKQYVDSAVTTGVGDLESDDVPEGTTNLYFTDARAVSALQGTDSSFSTVDIDSVAKQVAATATPSGTGGPEVVYSFDATTYRSAKFIIKLAAGAHTEVSEILVTLDTSNNIALTEYAIVGTNGNIGDVSASFNAGNVEITVTASSSVNATVMGTLLV